MAFPEARSSSSVFTVITEEGMDLPNRFNQSFKEFEVDEDDPPLATNINTPSKIDTSPTKWMKIDSCVNNCHLLINEMDQKNIFDSYWQNPSVVLRYDFISDMSKLSLAKESHKNSVIIIDQRTYYVLFSLNTFKGSQEVCKSCFRFILREQEQFIDAVLAQKMIRADDKDGEANTSNYLQENNEMSCKIKCYTLLSDKDQKQNFYNYWHQTTIAERCTFILNMTKFETNPNYKTLLSKGVLCKPYFCKFHLKASGGFRNICRHCFCLILKEDVCIVTQLLDEKWIEISSQMEDGEKFNEVINHINKFPLFESHHVTDSGNEKYLPRGLTLEKMYNFYKNEVQYAINFPAYERIFKKTKLRFLSSIVDKCLQCEAAEEQSQSENLVRNKIKLETFIASHLNGALKSHSFKTRDEKRKGHSLMICTFKFHQSLPTPFINNSIHYYKEPLWTYNFTIMESSKIKPTNGLFKSYVWDETQGRKTVNEIASCLYRYLYNLPKNIKTVVFYSSSCNGESRSKLLCMILSNIVINHPSLTLVEHKFLLDGHFYQDKNEKNDWCQDVLNENIDKIEEPQDWYNVLCKTADKNGSEVIIMENNNFYDFKGLLGNCLKGSIDGGKIDDDVTCVQYTKSGDVYFKKKWSGHFEVMYSENYLESQMTNFSKCLTHCNRIPLTEKKKRNLFDLLPFISSKAHNFYENLPTENNSNQNLLNSQKQFDSNLEKEKDLNLKEKNLESDKEENSNTNRGETNLNEENCLNSHQEKNVNFDKETHFNSVRIKVETIEDSREDEEEFIENSPEEVLIKEEIDVDNDKTSNKFSDDESEDEMELSQTNPPESEQTLNKNQIQELPLFSKSQDHHIKLFNEKFYENSHSEKVMEMVNNLERKSEQNKMSKDENESNDCSLGLKYLKKMKKFKLLCKCSNLCYLRVTPKDQDRIFSTYWLLGSAELRFQFLYDSVKVGPKFLKSEKNPEGQMQISIQFSIETDHGPQNVCQFCHTRIFCERTLDILTVIKMKSQALIDGIKKEVKKVENEAEKNMHCESLNWNKNEDISKWKAEEYNDPCSRLLLTEKLKKGWTELNPCRNGCFLTIKPRDQEQIYNSYWQGATVHSRYHFIHSSVKYTNPRATGETKSARRKYYHNSSLGPQRVCKRCFCLVLGETASFVESVLRNTGISYIQKKMSKACTSRSGNTLRISIPKVGGSTDLSLSNSLEDPKESSSKSVNVVDNEIQKESQGENRKELNEIENRGESSQQSCHTSERIIEENKREKISTVTTNLSNKSNHPGKIRQIQIVQEHIHDYLIVKMKKNPLKISVQTMYAQYAKTIPYPLNIGWYQNILSVNNVNYKPVFIGKCAACELYSEQFKGVNSLAMRDKVCDRLTSHLDFSTIVYKCKFQEEESARLMNSIMVCSFGFQQNFPMPCEKSSRNLSIFNLTIWQLTNNHVLNNPMFYVWRQVEGKRTANEIASCLFQYLKQLPSQVKSLIIYSSSCHGETRSKTLAMMFSYLMRNHKSLVSVDHKFTYSGHSQLKDYLHDGWIDDVMKDQIVKTEESEDWYKNFQNTAKLMNKSNITFMEPEMFMDFENLWKDPSVKEDPCISTEVMWLKYTKNGNIFFKKSLLERHNFEVLPLKGQHQFQDLLHLPLPNFNMNFKANESENQSQLKSSTLEPEKCIIKTEIDFDDDYFEYEEKDDEDYQEPSSKRRKTENDPLKEEESLRSKRIRKKRQILSL